MSYLPSTLNNFAETEGIVDPPEMPPAPPDLPPFYYDAGARAYLVPNNWGGWVAVNETAIRRELRRCRFSPKIAEQSYLSPLDEALSRITTENDTNYAGPLAGYDAGPHDILGRRVLVTDSPRVITACPGQWPILRAIIEGMMRDPEHDQLAHFYGWLKCSREMLAKRIRRPGQALAMAGPAESGKSLLQFIITAMLGGREARPYRYMCGASNFNRDLFGAEHLVIEDDNPSTDLRARRNFGARIKEMTVNSAASCHGKGREALSLTPFWRLTISVNDEPENMMMLPPLDESLRDKLILLRIRRPDYAMPTTGDDKLAFQKQLLAEVPAFAAFLDKWEIPKALQSARFGVLHFLHPALVESIDNLAPEAKLLDLIETELFADEETRTWEGSAAELERHLMRDGSPARRQAEKLFSFNTACGVYLGRLEDKLPERFSYKILHGCKRYSVKNGKMGGGVEAVL